MRQSLSTASPGHHALRQGSKTGHHHIGETGQVPAGSKKKERPRKKKDIYQEGKKSRKAKESTRKLFCVSLFLAKLGEKISTGE